MKRRGVTLALLWQEYRDQHTQGYAYSWFCERYSDWRKRITQRNPHPGGGALGGSQPADQRQCPKCFGVP
jgi:hypothetical protein